MSLYLSLMERIRQQGPIPFVAFMQEALYAPHVGYYSANLQKFGADGDFTTAPEISVLFGKTLARQCKEVMQYLDKPSIFEFGAGSGKLCVDLLQELECMGALPEHYMILELSADLKARQQALIASALPHLASRVHWLSSWPKEPWSGVVIANEVLDAMPVHRFLQTKEGLLESYIQCNGQGGLEETFKPCNDVRLIEYVQQVLPKEQTPYLSEANLFLEGWIKQCFDMLDKAVIILLDYGFPRHEYYHPERHQGTLMCHMRHRAHTDFLAHPGEQDITAHVDFTQVAEAAHGAGFCVAGYTNQASFLLNNGLLSLFEGITDEKQRFREQQALKQLLHPQEMGELFKVMALSKQMDIPLQGFQWQDKRASL